MKSPTNTGQWKSRAAATSTADGKSIATLSANFSPSGEFVGKICFIGAGICNRGTAPDHVYCTFTRLCFPPLPVLVNLFIPHGLEVLDVHAQQGAGPWRAAVGAHALYALPLGLLGGKTVQAAPGKHRGVQINTTSERLPNCSVKARLL